MCIRDSIVTGNVSSVVAVILAGVAFAAACYMELGKLPFDQAEACLLYTSRCV